MVASLFNLFVLICCLNLLIALLYFFLALRNSSLFGTLPLSLLNQYIVLLYTRFALAGSELLDHLTFCM